MIAPLFNERRLKTEDKLQFRLFMKTMLHSSKFTHFITAMVVFVASEPTSLTKPYTVKLVVSLSVTGRISPMGPIALEPVRLIVDIVNNRSDILPDYNVVVDVIDDQCDPAVGLTRSVGPFFLKEQSIFNSTNRIGQFQFPESFEIQQETANSFFMLPLFSGPICSEVCVPVGTLMSTFNTIHVHLT